MSVYRLFIATVAAMSLATAVFAADQTTTTTGDTATQASDAQQAKVDINKATAKELMKVKGLNAAKARAIVAYRKKHGEFKSLDDLKEVKGFKKMNEQTMKAVQDRLTIG